MIQIMVSNIDSQWDWIYKMIKVVCSDHEEFRPVKLLLQRLNRLEHCNEPYLYLITKEQFELLKSLDEIELIEMEGDYTCL
jgi:hypothetical protein